MRIAGRRSLGCLVLGGAVAAARPAGGQQPRRTVIGFLHSGTPEPFASMVDAFVDGLREGLPAGTPEPEIQFRWAMGAYERLPALAEELVRLQVAVIATGGGGAPAISARNATSTIPIAFMSGGDPVRLGLVAGLARPGGNVTGVNVFTAMLEAKRLDLLRELLSDVAKVAVLLNDNGPAFPLQREEVARASRQLGSDIRVAVAHDEAGLDAAFATLARPRVAGLVVGADGFFFDRRERIVRLALEHRIPTIYEQREFVLAGGLMSYGTSLRHGYALLGGRVARILRGDRPAEMPVLQPTKFELVINQRTARSLDIAIPMLLLGGADEVIE